MDTSFVNALDLEQGSNFIILVGAPGAGKTTIADELVEKFGFVKICPDNIREEVSGNWMDQTQNDKVFAIVYSRIEEFLERGDNIVYDATNCRSAYRFKIINVCKPYATSIICLCATTTIGECLSRNSKLIRSVPENIIERMYFTLKKHPPTIFEGYDMIVRF